MKRILDIIVSGIALLLLSPVMILIALVVTTTSKGGVFFRGPRVGQNGRTFRIFKFRSMVKDAEGQGKWNISLNDARVTRVGRFLRASKLDELPQFINVLRGEMSLVGPRPELQYYVDMYTEDEARVLQMKPGVTDWASLVNYAQYRAFTQSEDPDEHYLRNIRPLKLHLQLYQLEHQSILNDIRVLLWTAGNVLVPSLKPPADIQRVITTFGETMTTQIPEVQ